MNNRTIISTLILVSLVTLATGIGFITGKYFFPGQPPAGTIQGLLWPDPKVVGEFSMLDHEGNPFGPAKLQGKWSLLFFGYTHCPDVCPITLSALNQTVKILQEKRQDNNLQVLFVSVDAQRDTPEQIAGYVGYFNPGFIGLGGNRSQIDSIARQIGVAYFIGNNEGSNEYTVDHTASVFLIDPEKRLVGIYSAPHNADEIASRFIQIREFIQGQG